MTDPIAQNSEAARPSISGRRRYLSFAAGGALLVVGIVAGATGWALTRPVERMAFDPAMVTTQVSNLADGSLSKVEGRVTDVFGDKFVLEDASGRALIDTGRDGDDGALVTKDESVKVEGRYDRNAMHATALQHADGRTAELRVGPPHPGGPDDHDRPHHERHAPPPPPGGPHGGPDGTEPPPPPPAP